MLSFWVTLTATIFSIINIVDFSSFFGGLKNFKPNFSRDKYI